MLHDPHCRLLTLTGLGGIGKDAWHWERPGKSPRRLPSPIAAGIHFVSLALIGSVAFVVPASAEAIGLVPSKSSALDVQLLNYLRSKQMILVTMGSNQ